MKGGDNTYFGLESTDDILRLQTYESDLDQRHATDIENRLEMGRIYRSIKDLLPHDGTWGDWLKARHYSERECQRMMSVHEFTEAIPGFTTNLVGNLRSWAALRHLDESWGHLLTWESDGAPTLFTDDDYADDHAVFMKVLEKIESAGERTISVPMLESIERAAWAQHQRRENSDDDLDVEDVGAEQHHEDHHEHGVDHVQQVVPGNGGDRKPVPKDAERPPAAMVGNLAFAPSEEEGWLTTTIERTRIAHVQAVLAVRPTEEQRREEVMQFSADLGIDIGGAS